MAKASQVNKGKKGMKIYGAPKNLQSVITPEGNKSIGVMLMQPQNNANKPKLVYSMAAIARRLNFSRSTITREIRRGTQDSPQDNLKYPTNLSSRMAAITA